MGINSQRLLPERYQVVPRTLSFVQHSGHVLLLRGAPDKAIWPNLLNGVGGHVEADEDVYTAARREISEETGLDIDDLRLCGIINIPVAQPHTGVMLFVFTAHARTEDVRPSDEGTLEWVPCDHLPTGQMVADLPIILPLALSIGAGSPPFFAVYRHDERGEVQVSFPEGAPIVAGDHAHGA